jgi:hypothetical protein
MGGRRRRGRAGAWCQHGAHGERRGSQTGQGSRRGEGEWPARAGAARRLHQQAASRPTRHAVLSNAPVSSTGASTGFHATACTLLVWCRNVCSHFCCDTSHTCRRPGEASVAACAAEAGTGGRCLAPRVQPTLTVQSAEPDASTFLNCLFQASAMTASSWLPSLSTFFFFDLDFFFFFFLPPSSPAAAPPGVKSGRSSSWCEPGTAWLARRSAELAVMVVASTTRSGCPSRP